MDTRLAVLDAFLRELDRPLDISSKQDRLRTQKGVYLGQLTGVDLGYRYNWYVYGPYSPALAQDYYALAALPTGEKQQVQQASLNEETKVKLARARPLLAVPADVALDVASWLELLCSSHYLRRVNRFSEEQATEVIARQKGHLSAYVAQANSALNEAGFMS
jgi:uncharacterized protein YwgA